MSQVLEPEAEAARARFLARGECRHGHTLTPEGVYVRRDGLVECRACMADASRRHRERHKKPQRRVPEAPPVSCLRCPLARLLPETDMSQPRPRIFCGAFNSARPLCLEPCLRAEGEGLKPTRYASDAERAFILARYAVQTSGELGRLLARPPRRVQTIAKRIGAQRGADWKEVRARKANTAARAAHREAGNHYTAAQNAYLKSAYATDAWPHMGPAYLPDFKAEQQRRREVIVEEVARRGAPRSWKSIKEHVYRLQPCHERDLKKTRARRAQQKREARRRMAEAKTRAGA